MATAEQILALVRAHTTRSNDQFKTITLQIAASEAKKGHANIARELKALLDKENFIQPKFSQINTLSNLLVLSDPDTRLVEFVANPDVIERINRIMKEYLQRTKLNRYGLVNRRKLLIVGPPGTGKTMTASVIASELHLPLFLVQTDQMVSKYMGETGVKLRQIFDSIANIPGVYFFDEFDAIGANRNMDNEIGEMRRVLNSFLQFIEQDTSTNIIIAATNNQEILDNALFRRFDDILYYGLPKEEEIRELYGIKLWHEKEKSFSPSQKVIEASKGLSHAEITKICNDAVKKTILDDVSLSQDLFLDLISERKSFYSTQVS
jgi:SpoVK/Ycf46/Vps4 family AAA+-type ATPase